MWTRYLIQCNSCEKVTNLRLHIPEREILPITFQCLNCTSEIKGILKVDFKKPGWKFDLFRGKLIAGDYDSGDFFHEFSDVLPTKKPSSEPHNRIMPTMRIPLEKLEQLKLKKDLRKLHSNDDWDNLKDLVRAYVRFEKPIIEKLVFKIIGNIYPTNFFEYKIELDYHRNYFLALNRLLSSWINFYDHANYVEWISSNVFNSVNFNTVELNHFVDDIFNIDVSEKIKSDIADLTIRFIDLREYFYYVNDNNYNLEYFAGVNNFNDLKSFYTDCFEFIGRTSQYIFRIQNFYERGNLDNVPDGCPRNVVDGDSFAELNHGEKLKVLCLSYKETLKSLYLNCFDSKLRNGINHFKAKLDSDTQIIYYYPITKRPEDEYCISYIEFLNKSLNLFNSVLKIGQLAKIVNVYRYAKSNL